MYIENNLVVHKNSMLSLKATKLESIRVNFTVNKVSLEKCYCMSYLHEMFRQFCKPFRKLEPVPTLVEMSIVYFPISVGE